MKPYRIRQLAVTASTNDEAVKAAETGEGEGLVIHALKQTAGRGRYGRTWESPEGNLYCSVLLRPVGERKNYSQYSFVAALALGDTAQEFLPDMRIALKWPNDVLADGKKIAGILLESGNGYLVVGIGLNVMHHPENVTYPATSLHTLGASQVDMRVILETLLSHLSRWYDLMRSEGFAPVRAAWLKRAQKGRMTVKLPNETLEGDFLDIDAQGHLRLRLVDGLERTLTTGEVFFPKGSNT